VGYFAQHQVEQLDLEASALLTMQRLDASLGERDIRAFLGGFNFRGDKVMQAVGTYSGGQKARLVLALLIWQRPNLLLLDEPTNHLDLEMRLALNQALQGFDGSVILVSHDRHLLRSVCDDLWLVDGGALTRFEQDLDAYPAWLAQRKSSGSRPHGQAAGQGREQRRELKSQAARLNRIEREIMRLSETRKELERRLSESSIYEEKNREQLDDTLAEQAENRKRLHQAEEDWLQLSETIEAMQQSG